MSYSSSTARWQAVATRDPQSSAAFVYAVLTTRIYCRPTCPARLARRANVSFFDNSALAEAAGFRPCKRCRPADLLDPAERSAGVVVAACRVIESAAAEQARVRDGRERAMTLSELASGLGLSPRYLHRIFRERMGVTPKEYAERLFEVQRMSRDVSVRGASSDEIIEPAEVGAEDLSALLMHTDGEQALAWDFVAWELCSDSLAWEGGPMSSATMTDLYPTAFQTI